MKTWNEINKAAMKFSDKELLQEAFREGARYALTGKYYASEDMFPDAVFEGQNDTFEDWWKMYDKKRGKKKAKQKWDKLTKEQQTACLMATFPYVKSTPDRTYRKDPLTYLNGECWNDEIISKQDHEQQKTNNLAAKAARILGSDYQG